MSSPLTSRKTFDISRGRLYSGVHMGRPKKLDARTRKLTVAFSDAEAAKVELAATRAGLRVAQFVREAALESAAQLQVFWGAKHG